MKPTVKTKRSKKKRAGGFLIGMSFFIALLLTILPLPHWAIWLRPEWVFLVVLYWVVIMPYKMNVGAAWGVGLLLDLLTGTVLGAHALGLCVIAYLVVRFHSWAQIHAFWIQLIMLTALLIIYKTLLFWVEGLSGQTLVMWQYGISVLTSILLWPVIFILLQVYQDRFSIRLQ